jgi:hypothetical protein
MHCQYVYTKKICVYKNKYVEDNDRDNIFVYKYLIHTGAIEKNEIFGAVGKIQYKTQVWCGNVVEMLFV